MEGIEKFPRIDFGVRPSGAPSATIKFDTSAQPIFHKNFPLLRGTLTDYQKRMLMTFVNNAALGAYRQWIEDGKQMPLNDVIEMTNCLILGGVRSFFK